MVELHQLNKIEDILNSEGTILGLYKDAENNFYLSSFLSNGKGTVFYAIDLKSLKKYLDSKITIKDLYRESSTFLIKKKFRKDEKTYLKEDFEDKLQCGNDLYKDIPESMKSKDIDKRFW